MLRFISDVKFSFRQYFAINPPFLVVSDLCADDPCLNGGTCTDREGQITCLCLPTYTGHLCQTGERACSLQSGLRLTPGIHGAAPGRPRRFRLSPLIFPDSERCEPGWDKFRGSCYRHFSQRLSWEVAEQHCRTQGAHLVSVMSPEEQSYINSESGSCRLAQTCQPWTEPAFFSPLQATIKSISGPA